MGQRSKVRYPVHALLAVGGAGLLVAFNMVVGFVFMALVPPFIPVYVGILFAGACLVRSAVDYAVRVSVPKAVAMLRPQHDKEARPRSLAHARV
jgi:hypothetical protein